MRSRRNRGICGLILAAALFALPSTAQAADYNFETLAPSDYYDSTSYEDVYGSQYNYGGPNVVDYQIPDLEYGILSTTQTGIMEKALLPGLQQTVATNTAGGGYGISGGGAKERSLVGTTLLVAWAFLQTIGSVELIGRWLLGRLDEKEERMQRSFARLGEHLGESKAKGIFAAEMVAMVALKLALPVGLNQI